MTARQIFKLVFHKDSIALVAAIVFLWFTVGLIIDSNYDQKDLIRHRGYIVQIDSVIIKVKNKPLFKEITRKLMIRLNTEQKYFTSITTGDFGDITSRVADGDTVTIFTKPKLWSIFGMKRSSDISHLTKGSVILIDFEKYRQSLSGLFILTLVPAIGFFIFFYIRIRKRYKLAFQTCHS